jgi:hypothetical protein
VGCSVRVSSAFVVALLGVAPAAGADPVPECINAFEKAQVERTGGRLTRARNLLAVCSRQCCPAEIRQDCREWLFELEPRIPTIVLRARIGDGPDVADVRVYVDDELLVDRLDGRPVRVDPGARRLRWELAGHEPVETEVIVREGEKARFVSATFAPLSPPETGSPDVPRGQQTQTGIPAGTWVAGGIGLVGIASFAVFGLSAEARERELEDSCKPNCTPDEVRPAERQALLANVSLGVGIAGLAVATWLLVTAEPQPGAAQTGLGLQLGPGGAGAVVRTRF